MASPLSSYKCVNCLLFSDAQWSLFVPKIFFLTQLRCSNRFYFSPVTVLPLIGRQIVFFYCSFYFSHLGKKIRRRLWDWNIYKHRLKSFTWMTICSLASFCRLDLTQQRRRKSKSSFHQWHLLYSLRTLLFIKIFSSSVHVFSSRFFSLFDKKRQLFVFSSSFFFFVCVLWMHRCVQFGLKCKLKTGNV